MRLTVVLGLSALLVSEPVYARNDQVQRGPEPNWVTPSELMPAPENASGVFFVRRQDFVARLDDQGQAHYTGFRIKILHPNALQLGNLSIAWNPAAGPPTVHAIKVHRDGATVDVLRTASFEVLRREEQLEAASLDGILTAIFRVSDLRVGDELEFSVTVRTTDPTLGKKDAGLLVLAPNPASGRFRLGLSWTDGHKPGLKATPDMVEVANNRDRFVDFRFDNPPTLALPKDAPGRHQWKRVVEYSDFADWAAVSREFAPLFANAAKLSRNSALKGEAARMAAAHSTPLDRAKAALKLVQRDVRYVYVGLDGGNLQPAAAEETWQRRYGDCKGKTALLLALLAELGVQAEAVLVNNTGTDDGLDQRLPSPGMFDHVLVRAQIDGKNHWLDGTLPPVVPPQPFPLMPYRWVLPLTAEGKALDRLEWNPPTTPDDITLFDIDARSGFDQNAQIMTTTIVRGVKGLQQQIQLSGLTAAQLLASLREEMIGDYWQSVDAAQWRYDEEAQASVLTISGTGRLDWDDDGGGAKSLSLPGGGFSPPEKRVRASDHGLPYYKKSEFDCNVTSVRLPKSTQEMQWSFNSTYDTRIFGANYRRVIELRDGTIRMIRGFRVEQPEIDAVTARRDNERIAAFDNSMAWIYYNPVGRKRPATGDKGVPAAYETDWLAHNVPCLSTSALEDGAK